MERDRGTVVALAGVALFVVSLAASAALAPPRTVGPAETETGGTFVGIQGAGTNLHETGNVHLRNGSTVEWKRTAADSYFEVERLSDGRLVVAFIEGGREECGRFESPCPRTGYRILAPDGGEVLSEWSFPVRDKGDSELHSVEPLPDGGFAIADMEYERLAVVENGSIAWEWSASSFYDAPPDPTRVDWLHINDVNHIGEDRFLLSVRNANQLLVIERGAGVVEVINEDRGEGSEETCRIDGELADYDGDEDGAVRCGNPEILHRQHNPHWLGNGSVLVADSDNDRVVELHRTADGWEPVWTRSRAAGLGFDWPRDADRLPDGTTLVTDTYNKRIVEINDSGVVRSISTDNLPYEADRLPVGEASGVPLSTVNDTVDAAETAGRGGELPVLSTLVIALHSGVPWMPYWVGELQVLLWLVSALVVVAGGVLRYRN
jgi:hypothetical protein